MLYIIVQSQTFAIYADFIENHAPGLYSLCYFANSHRTAVSPRVLQAIDIKTFELLQRWMYSMPNSAGLITTEGERITQESLINLWILAKALSLPRLQNDAIDALDEGGKLGRKMTKESLGFIPEKTKTGDMLRRYSMHVCARMGSMEGWDEGVTEGFLLEASRETKKNKEKYFKREDGKDVMGLNIAAYHVSLEG